MFFKHCHIEKLSYPYYFPILYRYNLLQYYERANLLKNNKENENEVELLWKTKKENTTALTSKMVFYSLIKLVLPLFSKVVENFFVAEAARIEAQIKAAETASRMRAEAELKMQREREREAARLALQKVYIFPLSLFT